jgi:hypothetical protein
VTTGEALYSMAASHRGWDSVTVLSQAEIDGFVAQGYVAIRGAVPPGVAQACQDVIWSELGQHGVLRDDPSTWTEPVVRIPGVEWSEAARRAVEASAHRPTALATGRAGDVFLCHPFLVHAASWPHRGRVPRMMAQPPVALLGEYPLHGLPPAPPSPVEQAILGSLGSARR